MEAVTPNESESDRPRMVDSRRADSRFVNIVYSCQSFLVKGRCKRAHTSNCPFVIKGVDYSKECIYSNSKQYPYTKSSG
jgi:hypothetical protein